MEKENGENDAVHGFEVVAEVDRESGNDFQDLYLQGVKSDRANGCED